MYAGMKRKGAAYGGGWNGVTGTRSVDGVGADADIDESGASVLACGGTCSSRTKGLFCAALEVRSSWRKRIAVGLTDTMSPGASRVFAF